MSSQKKESLLGNKRSKRSESEDNSNESSDESDDGQPVKSIFTNPNEQGFSTGGLFGNNSSSNPSKGLFGDLSNTNSKPKSLFGDSLFKPASGSLFGNTNTSGLFSASSSLFSNINNTAANNTKDDEEENENDDNDDNNDKPASPNGYNPENEIGCDENAFNKIYVKKVESFYLFSKGEEEGDKKGKYVNRGEGFLSIETKDDKESGKRFAVVMMRNTIGNVLCEGILNEKFNKFISYEKKFKHVAHFYFLVSVNEKDKKKVEAGNAKVPYSSEDDMKKFEEKYKEAIEFLKGKKEEEKEKEKEKSEE